LSSPTGLPFRLPVKNFIDERGALGVIEPPELPFSVRRFYFLHDMKVGEMRGRHAHIRLEQVMICLAGCVDVTFWDGEDRTVFRLQDRHEGIYVPPGYWREIMPQADQSILAVLASEPYDPDDYIATEDMYVDFIKNGRVGR
jgi:dTDP-4-dehydrorhamnose 3,5-epimerase-like enzyme